MKYLALVLPLLALGCDPVDPPAKDPPPAKVIKSEPPAVARAPKADPPAPKKADPPPVSEPKKEFRTPEIEEQKEDPPEEAPPIPDSFKPLNKSKTLFFETMADGSRRVHLLTEVCLREGPMEVLVCKTFTKEHESILRVDADGKELHTALVAAKAVPGTPVKFVPEYKAASGTSIKISLTYREKGKVKTATAGEWIKDRSTNKDMAHDWVFAGSKLLKDPDNPGNPPFYTASSTGEYICLANFQDSILDLPVKSPKDVADLVFEVNTARIPPLRTPVIVTLEPVVKK